MHHKLSPSHFSFLYERCKRCYYLTVVRGFTQPSIPLPSVFTKIAGLLKEHYDGKRTSELHPALPPGVVKYGEEYVQSQPIKVSGCKTSCFIRGRFDIVIQFDDKSYGVIDFKTGHSKDDSNRLYGRQLHAYAYALEHPATGALALSPVTKLGLLYFYPQRTDQKDIGKLLYEADIQWVEIKKREEAFLKFIKGVLGIGR